MNFKKIFSFLWGYKITTTESPLNGKLEVWYRDGQYVLDSEHANYSFGSLHRLFRLIFMDVNPVGKSVNNALLLGLGAGSVIKILKDEWNLPVRIVAVEHDPVVLRLGKRYFKVDEYKDTEIVEADAFEFVKQTQERFDMIIIDLFIDSNVPKQFTEADFLDRIEEIMNPKGVLIFNFITRSQSQKRIFRQALWYINQQYYYTKDLPVLGNNIVIIARKY